jgi:hypothetical protein
MDSLLFWGEKEGVVHKKHNLVGIQDYVALILELHISSSRDKKRNIIGPLTYSDKRRVGVRVPAGSRIFIYPQLPDRLCGPPSLLYNVYQKIFPRGKAARAWS